MLFLDYVTDYSKDMSMFALFLVYVAALALMGFGLRKAAMIVTLVNILLCLAMFWHHATDVLKIAL
jgi:hypothetical protein